MGGISIFPIVAGLLGPARADVNIPPEWTFEQARACWKPMVRPAQHVGVPGYPFQTAVFWDGALVFGPLGFRELNVMKRETARLGDNLLHVSFAFGDQPAFADRTGVGSPRIRRWLEGGALPMPFVETTDGDLLWTESVFAHLLGTRPNTAGTPEASDSLVTHAQFTVRNTSQAQRTAHLWMHFGRTNHVTLGYKCAQHDELGEAVALEPVRPDGGAVAMAGTRGPVIGLLGDMARCVIPSPSAGILRRHAGPRAVGGVRSPAPNLVEWEASLEPGAEATLRLIVPYGTVARVEVRRLLGLETAAERRTVSGFWRKVLSGPGTIVTPDAFLNDYLGAVAGQMAQQTAYRRSADLWMYKTSPNHYEGYWPCNAAKALPVFDLRGLRDLNRLVLSGFLQSQTDDIGGLDRQGMGAGERLAGEGFGRITGFLGNFGEWTANPLLISHGLGIWALASHYRITRDDAWLYGGSTVRDEATDGSPLAGVLRAFDWVSAQRRRTMHEENGARAPNWGLLPAASAHDWLAGSTIFNDAYCIFGMAEAVRLLREIGHPRAEACAAELADYRACLRERYVEARDRARAVPLPDGSLLPYVPRMVRELDWAAIDWTYTGYGPLRAGAWGALDPYDALVTQSLQFLEEGMPKGEGPYFGAHLSNAETADANWADISDPFAARHHLWRHYVEYETMWPVGSHLFLARDDLPRFFEWLTHNFAVVVHRDWRVGVESLDGVPSCAPGDAERWLAVRSMFVHETGGYDGSAQALFLLQAIPREWMRAGASLSVSRMGTWFGGTVDLNVRVSRSRRATNVTVRLKGLRVLPAAIRMRLRSGDGAPARSVKVDGRAARVEQGDIVSLPPTHDAVFRIVAEFGDARE